jgi:hypothetical protein
MMEAAVWPLALLLLAPLAARLVAWRVVLMMSSA